MSTNSSYNIRNFSTGIDAERKRLDSQIDLFWKKEAALYHRLGIRDGSRIADFGCGTGYLIELLHHEFPQARFTGVERDQILVDFARERLKDIRNIETVIHSSVQEYNSGPSQFDYIFMRLVLEHIPDPVTTLKHIRTFLKPNGKVILIDNDFDYHLFTYPDIPELDLLYDSYRRSRRSDGGNPCIGRQLPFLLSAAGYSEIDLEIITAHNHMIGDRAFLSAEGGGIPAQLTQTGFFSEKHLDTLVKNWSKMLKTDGHCLFRQLFVAIGTAASAPGEMTTPTESNKKSTPVGQQIRDTGNFQSWFLDRFSEVIGQKVSSIETSRSLIDLGLDSVGALSLQMDISTNFHVDFSISELIGGMNYHQIVELFTIRAGISGDMKDIPVPPSVPEQNSGFV